MSENGASPAALELIPAFPIPDHLIGEVRSKLAYVDEAILAAEISAGGDRIRLSLHRPVDPTRQAQLDEKVQRVVTSMVKGAFRPKQQVLEDHLGRPTHYAQDPMAELIQRRQVSQEMQGVFALGPQLARLMNFFEDAFCGIS